MASVRIQRWELIFVSYEYTIKYKSGAANSDADALSRLPLPDPSTSEVPIPSELVLLLDHMASGPLTAPEVKTMTIWDPVLSRVHSYVLQGWPDSSSNPYSSYRRVIFCIG